MDEKVQEYFDLILECTNELDLVDLTTRINSNRDFLDFRDFVMMQTLIIAKSNDLAITNLMDAIEGVQHMDLDEDDMPPPSERH